MAELVRIYLRLVGARARGQLEYRASLVLQLLGTAALTVIDFVAILVLFEERVFAPPDRGAGSDAIDWAGPVWFSRGLARPVGPGAILSFHIQF